MNVEQIIREHRARMEPRPDTVEHSRWELTNKLVAAIDSLPPLPATWVAWMDTEHFEFHAFGDSEADARQKLADGFAAHLRARHPDGAFDFWSDDDTPPTADRLGEYYGIRTLPCEAGKAYCDREPL